MKKTLPINLQFFADGGADNGGQDNNAGGTNNNAAGQNSQGSAGIDYDKIQEIVNTATTKKENAVLKSYFQQQGLSEDEVSQAIATFKENKAQQTAQQQNDTAQLQNQVAAANQEAEKVRIELAATQVAITLGIEAKTVPYVLKMADFSKAKGTDVPYEQYKKVLDELNALKTEKQETVDLTAMTVEELTAFAKDKGIDIGQATSQEGIIKKIRAALEA